MNKHLNRIRKHDVVIHKYGLNEVPLLHLKDIARERSFNLDKPELIRKELGENWLPFS